jgi:acyl-CoA carboxylase subunit beta
MAVLGTCLDGRTPSYMEHRGRMREMLADVDAAVARACEGGGEKQVTRHHARGKLLPRERIELLADRDSAVLELSTVAGYGTELPVGAGLVTGLAMVAGRPCVVAASDATVRGGALNALAARKMARATEIALVNTLPMVILAESGGPDPDARLRTAGIPWVCALFAAADHTIVVRGQTSTRPAELAEDERDAIRLVRQAIERLGPSPRPVRRPIAEPRWNAEDLLAVAQGDEPLDPREILGRILDGSDFDEVTPLDGTGRCAGFGSVHGYRIGVLTGAGPVLSVGEMAFVRLAAAACVPLVVLAPSPVITIAVGAAEQPFGECSMQPRFRFSWPDASALHRSGQLDDDGVIDPRDTRTVLGICLSVLPSPGGRTT